MFPISYRRHRLPPTLIQHAVWLYLRFTLSYRDVEELLAQQGLDLSYESVRCWVLKFGPMIARRLRECRPRPELLLASRRDGGPDRRRQVPRPRQMAAAGTIARVFSGELGARSGISASGKWPMPCISDGRQ